MSRSKFQTVARAGDAHKNKAVLEMIESFAKQRGYTSDNTKPSDIVNAVKENASHRRTVDRVLAKAFPDSHRQYKKGQKDAMTGLPAYTW